MSKYTTEVRYICESFADLSESGTYTTVDEVINKSMSRIFDFEYPIFDGNYKTVLQKKILKHYYTREIGAETVGLWKLWLNTRLNEIMPYYNKLYESALLKFDPLTDVDVTRTHTGSGTNTGKSKSNVENVDKFSETPQGGLSNIRNETYLTSASIVSNDANSSTDINTTEEYIERVVGKQSAVSYPTLVKQYRDILLNIDVDIINELSDLFINLW